MKALLIIGIIVLLGRSSGMAQQVPKKDSKFELHINPLTPFDDMSRFRIGVEYISHERFGYLFDIGFKSGIPTKRTLPKITGILEDWGQNYNILEFRTEIKRYLHPKSEVQTNYYAAELFFVNSSYQLKHHFYTDHSINRNIFYSTADFNRRKAGIHLKYGWKFIPKDHLVIDFYVGEGVAFRKVTVSNVSDPQEDVGAPFIKNNYIIIGNYFMLNSTAGFKIGYRF